MQLETQFVEEMVELFSDTPFANGIKGEKDKEYFQLSYERLSVFFRNQHRLLIAGDLTHLVASPRLQEAAEWVRVEDGLPEESGYILAYDKNNVFPTQMRWYDVGFELKQVCTHWRPLPAPPKPNNEKK